jgi:hypothetical protein
MNVSRNPFDLNLARAYSAPEAFCARPQLEAALARAAAGQVWTLIDGERRMGKSSAVIADSVRHDRPILHVDLMGVSSQEEINERFRWGWRFFSKQLAGGFWKQIKPELSAKIPGTGVSVKLSNESTKNEEPDSCGDVIVAYDTRIAQTGGLLFMDEFQDLGKLPDEGQKMSRSLRAALQMSKHITPILAGSSQHLLAPFFATSAAAFFKSIGLQHHMHPFTREDFGEWAARIFRSQKRRFEELALVRIFELTDGVTADLVAVCAEVWVQGPPRRPITVADIETGWRYVVANAAEHFLPKISTLSELQARLLRHVAQNPRTQPYSQATTAALHAETGSIHGALDKLLELELLNMDERDGRKRIWVHDARLAFYLRA